jgi:hypothetical protein
MHSWQALVRQPHPPPALHAPSLVSPAPMSAMPTSPGAAGGQAGGRGRATARSEGERLEG